MSVSAIVDGELSTITDGTDLARGFPVSLIASLRGIRPFRAIAEQLAAAALADARRLHVSGH